MNFFVAFVEILCQILTVAIFLRAIISWFPVDPGSRFVAILYQVTEPILSPLRSIIPRIGMMDISPLVAIIVLQVIAGLIGIL
ncbi:MAG: YggT family protein [Chloroflexota bacterium]